MKRALQVVSTTVVVLCAFGLLTSAIAIAAPGWSAPINYPLKFKDLTSPVVAFQNGGTSTIAYVTVSSQTVPYRTSVNVGTVVPGHAYSAELKVSSTATVVPDSVSLSVAPNGAAVAAWVALTSDTNLDTPSVEMASYRRAGSRTWSKPVKIATDAQFNQDARTVITTAISTNGDAAVGVTHVDPTISDGTMIDVAVHGASGGFGKTTQISPPSDGTRELQLAFDAHGNLTAAFGEELSNDRFTLGSVRRPASSGIWGSFEDLTGSDLAADVYNPQLAVSPSGSAVIAFQYDLTGSQDVTAVTRSGATGSWSAMTDLAPGGTSSNTLGVAVSATNRAYVLYTYLGQSSDLDCVGAVRATIGSAFSAAECISPLGFQENASVGVQLLGNNAYFAWSGTPENENFEVPQASRWLDKSPTPESFTNLGASDSSIGMNELVPDYDGSMVVFWHVGNSNAFHAAAYDAGGPNLVSSKVPKQATAGKSVKLTAKFTDLWSSPVAKLSWSFGDKQKGSGAAVTHKYKKAGDYTVTVTAKDRLGNTTVKKFKIKVTAARKK